MNKFTLSVVAIMAMSTFASAGGDIAPVEPVAEVVVPVVDSRFYVGIAYSAVNVSSDYEGIQNVNDSWTGEYEADYEAIMLKAGYKINKYFAVEGRYWESAGDAEWTNEGNGNYTGPGAGTWKTSGTNSDAEFTAWGLYAKPMYPVTEAVDVYALLGYGNNTLSYDGVDELDENGFHWGLGASYDLTDNLSLFVDYVHMHAEETSSTSSTGGRNGSAWSGDITSDDTIYTLNFGVTYKF